MKIGLCYETVLPARGGCEHYIGDLARRLAKDHHEVHLFACRWEAASLPPGTIYHQIPTVRGPRFLRPYRFAKRVLQALHDHPVDVSIGFDKTWGQSILYPQGGLHSASRRQNLLKYPSAGKRLIARLMRVFDPTSYTFRWIEKKQYLSAPRPLVIVNSKMVQRHFQEILGFPADAVRVIYSSIDPERFHCEEREQVRQRVRQQLNIPPTAPVGLFVGMNYRLKGLQQLLNAVKEAPESLGYHQLVIGGSKFQGYQEQATKLGIAHRVHFLGFQADPKDYFFASDFLTHPTFYDPCSLVALEALGCGLPVITTQYNGASEFIQPGKNGTVIADPHDAPTLGQAIADFCQPTLLPERKQAAEESARGWTFENHYQQILEVIEQAASKVLSK